MIHFFSPMDPSQDYIYAGRVHIYKARRQMKTVILLSMKRVIIHAPIKTLSF